MNTTEAYLSGIGQLADKLTQEIAALSYEQFAEDAEKIESAVVKLAVIKEGWTRPPDRAVQVIIVKAGETVCP